MAGLADLIVERLRGMGTRAIFGVPGGGGNLDLIEAARGAGLPFVLTSTETAGAFAAIAQADATGSPGACLTTLGPGAASAVNGVACAHLERAPVVVFTDSNPAGAGGRFTHQQIDHSALFASITKWSGRLTPATAGDVVDRACRELCTLPPGPVHIDWPGDVKEAGEPHGVGDARNGVTRWATRAAVTEGTPAPASVPPASFVRDVALARRPLLLVGLGARSTAAAAAIRACCERHHVPAMVTYKAKGVVPDAHECFAGLFTNGAIERTLLDQSDVLIGVGLDPVELLPRPWTIAAPIVGVGRWTMPVDHVPFVAQWATDVPAAMAWLSAHLGRSEWDLSDVARTVRAQRARLDLPAGGMTPTRVVAVAAQALAATSRVAVDAGAHMFPATMLWPVAEPNDLLISNGLATMGFALPAAIGAALIDRTRIVVALTGDGGLLMCVGELLTAVRENLRIIVIVFNDASLSLIEIKQQARRLPAAGVALGAVNWLALAESFGLAAFAASTEAELSRAIEKASAHEGPSLIDARVDRSTYGEMLRMLRG